MRERTIERLKNGKLDIVVATDVAARGLDVERITHVVNYDIPHDVEGYIHRIGRTGRAGRSGHAILFVMPRERRILVAIERATRQRVEPMRLPTREDVADRRAAQFKDTITEVLGSQDLDVLRADRRELRRGARARAAEDRRGARLSRAEGSAARAAARARVAPRAVHGARPVATPSAAAASRRPMPRAAPRAARRVPRARTSELVRYRIEVGHEHGVQPGNIVGAIANEAGIDAAHIGRIEIFDSHSIVGLPDGMPKDIYQRLRKAWVCGQQLSISVDSGGDAPKRLAARHQIESESITTRNAEQEPMTSDSMTIGDDSVVSFHYKLRDDTGTFNESSEGGSPVVYMHGHNNIVPGLEKELAGKKSGDKLTATVAPEEGYGQRNENAVQRVPLKHLATKGPIAVGQMVVVNTREGGRQAPRAQGRPLQRRLGLEPSARGQDADVRHRDRRGARGDREELAHGHAHGPHGHDH